MKLLKTILPILMLSLYLGISNGKLALFRKGSAYPLQVYDHSVAAYPSAEQKALLEGIPIENDAHLASLLEDFLS